jgi:uncharacterized protein (DUF697 family)
MTLTENLAKVTGALDGFIVKLGDTVGIKVVPEGKGEQESKALTAVRRYSTLSFVGGFVPFTYVDLALISTAQLAMLAEIAKIYDVPFNKERVKLITSALLGSVVPQGLAAGVAGSAIKSIPLIGQAVGVVLMPGFAAAFAYALGKVFIDHFETGGTLLDLDPEKLKGYFKAHFDSHQGREPDSAEAPAAETPAAE